MRTKTINGSSRAGIALALAASALVVAPPQSPAAKCRPTTAMTYDGQRAAYSFSYPASCRTPAMGRVRVSVSVERCAEVCTTIREKTICTFGVRCSLRVRVEHPPVEVAEYTGRASYRSSGKAVAAGARTAAATCVTAAATWLCM